MQTRRPLRQVLVRQSKLWRLFTLAGVSIGACSVSVGSPNDNAGGAAGKAGQGAGGAPANGTGGVVGEAGGGSGGNGGGISGESGSGSEARAGAGTESEAGRPAGGGSEQGEGGSNGGEDGPPAAPRIVALATGDPHLLTFDGVRYDCQPWGEETLVVSDTADLEVQMRTHQLRSANVSVITAVATRVGKNALEFFEDGTTTLNGKTAVFAEGRSALPGDEGTLWFSPRANRYVIVWPDNSQVWITPSGYFMSVKAFLSDMRRGHVSGLFGNANADPKDDLTTRDEQTTLTSPAPFRQFYQTYVESWRVSHAPDGSIFSYDDGQDTETFTNRNFPIELETRQGLSDSDVQAATPFCKGVAQAWLDSCLLDVARSDDGAAAAAAFDGIPAASSSFDVNGPLADPNYAWYVLDETEGTTAHDSSTNHFDITNLTAVTWDQGANFTGTGGGGSTTVTSAFRTLPITLSAWLKPELRADSPNAHALQPYPANAFSGDIPGAGGFGLGLNIWASGSALADLGLSDCCAAATTLNMSGSPSCPNVGNCQEGFVAGKEHFVVLAIGAPGTGGTASGSVYVDGALFDTSTATLPPAASAPPLFLGMCNTDSGYGSVRFYDGRIRDARIYTRELPADEVFDLYRDGPLEHAPAAATTGP
jgi:hypothetical protein